MSLVPFIVRKATPADLVTALNAALAPLLSAIISNFEIGLVTAGTQPFYANNLFACFSSNTSGATTLTQPFQTAVFSAPSDVSLDILINQFVAANPSYFIIGPFPVYRTTVPDPDKFSNAILVYNTQGAAAAANWGGSGGAAPAPPSGPASGDLYGNYPGPQVGGFRGVALQATAPIGGAGWIYNATTNTYQPAQTTQYFANHAAAVAAAAITPFINGTYVVLYPGSPTTEEGTYQISGGGTVWPGDYTFVSPNTDMAANVTIIDTGAYYAPNNVEAALQEVGAGTILPTSGALSVGATTIATTPTTFGLVEWEVELINGTQRYTTTVSASTDGATVNVTEFGNVPSPGVGVLPVTFDASIGGGNISLVATSTASGWSYRIRQMVAFAA